MGELAFQESFGGYYKSVDISNIQYFRLRYKLFSYSTIPSLVQCIQQIKLVYHGCCKGFDELLNCLGDLIQWGDLEPLSEPRNCRIPRRVIYWDGKP